MNPVIHFEFPVDDPDRARAFYESVFDWQTHSLGPEFGNFVLAFTADTDDSTRIPKVRGAINGGFAYRSDPDAGVRVTVLVDDLRASLKKIEDAGGTMISQITELPGVGLFATFADPEGNVVQLNEDFTIKRLPT